MTFANVVFFLVVILAAVVWYFVKDLLRQKAEADAKKAEIARIDQQKRNLYHFVGADKLPQGVGGEFEKMFGSINEHGRGGCSTLSPFLRHNELVKEASRIRYEYGKLSRRNGNMNTLEPTRELEEDHYGTQTILQFLEGRPETMRYGFDGFCMDTSDPVVSMTVDQLKDPGDGSARLCVERGDLYVDEAYEMKVRGRRGESLLYPDHTYLDFRDGKTIEIRWAAIVKAMERDVKWAVHNTCGHQPKDVFLLNYLKHARKDLLIKDGKLYGLDKDRTAIYYRII